MRAVRYSRYGGPEVLDVVEAARPSPGPGQVLLRVYAAALNPYDWHAVRGLPLPLRLDAGWRVRSPRGLGVDVAGTVADVAPDVTGFQVGDRVFGVARDAVAELAVAQADRVVPVPLGLDMAAAAGLPLAGSTALQGLRDRGGLQPGRRVLVLGASGGVGTLAVQIAKAMGAHVTATCSTQNVDLLSSLGVDCVVDYTSADVSAAGETFDVVLDNVATTSLRRLSRVVAADGCVVMVGGTARGRLLGPYAQILPRVVRSRLRRPRVVTFLAEWRHDDLAELARLVEQGSLCPVVDRVFTMDQTAEALAYLETGRARGKVVVAVNGTHDLTGGTHDLVGGTHDLAG